MAWTPREDAALLRAKAKLRVLLTPALQQSQRQDVAFDVAVASGAAIRTADECLERYEALLSVARSTDKSLWPGDEKMRKLLQAALSREARLPIVTRKTTRYGAKENLVGPANDLVKVGVVRSESEPSSIVAASASACAPSVEAAQATAQAASAPEPSVVGESSGADEPVVFRSRPKRPLGYEATTVFTVDHDKAILSAVKETERGKSERWYWHKVGLRVTEETARYIAPSKCKLRFQELSKMSQDEIQCRSSGGKELLMSTANTSGENTTSSLLIETTPSAQAASSSEQNIRRATTTTTAVSQTPINEEREAPVDDLTSASSSNAASGPSSPLEDSEIHGMPPEEQADQLPPSEADVRTPRDDARREEIPELRKALVMVTASLSSLRSEISHVVVENTELKSAVVDLRMQLDRSNRAAAVTAAEMTILRAEMEQIKRENGNRVAMEIPSNSLRCELAEMRKLQEQNFDFIESLVTRYKDNEKADSQRRAIIFEMIETETCKREKLTMMVQQLQANYERDRQKQEDGTQRLEGEVSQVVERQDEAASLEALSFEIIEAEVRKREELEAAVRELAVHVGELRSEASSGQHSHEQSLL